MLHRQFVPNPFRRDLIQGVVIIVAISAVYSLLTWRLFQQFPIVSYLVMVGALVFALSFTYWKYDYERDIVRLQDRIEEERTIIHACGAITGSDGEEYTYVNCLEPLENSISHDNHFIEIDFDRTSDDRMVCVHYFHGDITEEEYLSEQDYGQFTRMNLDMLANVIKANPDVYVITDIKGNYNLEGCRLIADRYPELRDNFIIQVYHDSEYEPVSKMGFKYIILTLYGTDIWEREIPEIQRAYSEHDYLGITFWEIWITCNPDNFEGIGVDEAYREDQNSFYRSIQSIGMPVYVHTVNDKGSMAADITAGVSAIYTDNVDNEWIRKR